MAGQVRLPLLVLESPNGSADHVTRQILFALACDADETQKA